MHVPPPLLNPLDPPEELPLNPPLDPPELELAPSPVPPSSPGGGCRGPSARREGEGNESRAAKGPRKKGTVHGLRGRAIGVPLRGALTVRASVMDKTRLDRIAFMFIALSLCW